MPHLILSIADVVIRIQVEDTDVWPVLEQNFAHMATDSCKVDLIYLITRQTEDYQVLRDDCLLYQGRDLADLVFYLEKDLIIAVQLATRGVLFFHAAALSYQGKSIMIVGESGAGKSSVSWGLLQHGFRYLSDELVPVSESRVYPFQRAINLKKELKEPYGFPADAMHLGRFSMLPVAAAQLADNMVKEIDAIFFVKYDKDQIRPMLELMPKSDAFLFLFKNLLNSKSFADYGMQAIHRLLQKPGCYRLVSVTDMIANIEQIKTCLAE